MNTIQVTACQPGIYVKNISQFHHLSKAYVYPTNTSSLSRTLLRLRAHPSSGLHCVPMSKARQPLHVCFAGEEGMMGNNNEVIYRLSYTCWYQISHYICLEFTWLDFSIDALRGKFFIFLPLSFKLVFSLFCAAWCKNIFFRVALTVTSSTLS